MIAPLWLVAGQGVGRDTSFNVEGTSLNLKQGTPCSQADCGETGVPRACSAPAVVWRVLGALELSALQPVGNGSWTEVWGPSILPPMIMGRRGACRGNVIASAWPELPPSPDLPLVPWLFWWDVFPCGHGPMLVCSPRTHAKSWGSPQAMYVH